MSRLDTFVLVHSRATIEVIKPTGERLPNV